MMMTMMMPIMTFMMLMMMMTMAKLEASINHDEVIGLMMIDISDHIEDAK